MGLLESLAGCCVFGLLLLLILGLTTGAVLSWFPLSRLGRVDRLLELASNALKRRQFATAEPLFLKAAKLHAGINDQAVADSIECAIEYGLGYCRLAEDDFAAAEKHFERAVELIDQGVEQTPDLKAHLFAERAVALSGLGKVQQAELALDRVDELCRQTPPEQAEIVAQFITNSAGGAAADNLYECAFALAEKAVGLLQSTKAWHGGQLAESQITLASFYSLVGQYARARELVEQAVSAAGDDELDEDARESAHFQLAQLDMIGGDLPAAISHIQRSHNLRSERFGANHFNTAIATASLAGFFRVYGDYERSEKTYRAAYDNQRAQLQPNDPILAGTAMQFALLLADIGEYDEAESLLASAERVALDASLAKGNLFPAVRIVQALLLRDRFRDSEAIQRASEALQCAQRIYGPFRIMTCEFQAILAACCARQQQFHQAEALLADALAVREAAPDSSIIDEAELLDALGELYVSTGRAEKGKAEAERALAMIECRVLPANLSLASMHTTLGEACHGLGSTQEAIEHFQHALDIRQRIQPRNHPRLVRVLTGFASALEAADRPELAQQHRRRAEEIRAHHTSGA